MPSIRHATLDDIHQLHRLIEGAYRGDSAKRGWTHEADLLGGQRIDDDALHHIITDPKSRILLLASNVSLMGCVQISDLGQHKSYLGLLAVDPAIQAGGLGKRLIMAAEKDAVALFSTNMIEMTVIRQRTDLIAYYERRGYILTGESRPFPYGDDRFGLPIRQDMDFVVLQKALT